MTMHKVVLYLFVLYSLLSDIDSARNAKDRRQAPAMSPADRLISNKLDEITALINDLKDKPPPSCFPGCQGNEVCIDLNNAGTTTGSIPGFPVVSSQTDLIANKPCSRQGVFKVEFKKMIKAAQDLCLESYPIQKMLKIQMYLSNGERSGWLYNIGDSVGNNGYGGDAGQQDFSAEVHGLSGNIYVYENTRIPASHNCTADNSQTIIDGVTVPASIVNHWVANHFLKITNDNGVVTQNCSACLFGLEGQEDVRGDENEEIFISANRVIAYHGERTGVGLCYIKMRWVGGPNE